MKRKKEIKEFEKNVDILIGNIEHKKLKKRSAFKKSKRPTLKLKFNKRK